MADVSDIDLLQNYYRHGSEDAFAELVRRHVNLVYSAALRHVGTAAQAEEIAQAVFVILSRKAAGLRPDTILEAWLYETTRLTSLAFLRGERRRQSREQEAYMQSTLPESDDAASWNQLAPLLDDAMTRLGKKEREAVVLRFFKDKSLKEVAVALHVSEAAAQSRVHRAVRKLQRYFSRSGINSTSEAITGAISAYSVHAAPVALAKTATTAVLVKGATASISTSTLIKAALKVMAWTKAKTAVVAGIGVLLFAGTAAVTVKVVAANRGQPWQRIVNASAVDSAPPQVTIIPALRSRGNIDWWGGRDGKWVGLGVNSTAMVQAAYGASLGRLIFSVPPPEGRYDFMVNLPNGSEKALQQEIKKQFGLIGTHAMIQTNVLVLTLRNRDVPGLNPNSDPAGQNFSRTSDAIQFVYAPMSKLVEFLENALGTPIVDHTGLTGHFDIYVKWDSTPDGLKKALLPQLGLELVPGRESIEYLVVEKTN
jgi:uncharacterized protein (TIGR03435 family)